MRSRWSLFRSGLIVFSVWYVISYGITNGAFIGVLSGSAFGLGAAVGGLIFGAVIGVAAHAIDLFSVDRDVRAGDARDGVRVSLGKLPPIVPVVRANDDVGGKAPTEPVELVADLVSEPLPAAEQCISDVVDIAGTSLPESDADAQGVPATDRLGAACARFVAEHDSLAWARGEGDAAVIGTIDRIASPAEFGEFMALVSALAGDGVNVSRVAVSVGPDSLPARVTFPVSGAQDD